MTETGRNEKIMEWIKKETEISKKGEKSEGEKSKE